LRGQGLRGRGYSTPGEGIQRPGEGTIDAWRADGTARSRDTATRGDAWETKSREAYLIGGVSWYWAREGKKGRETGTDSTDKRENKSERRRLARRKGKKDYHWYW